MNINISNAKKQYVLLNDNVKSKIRNAIENGIQYCDEFNLELETKIARNFGYEHAVTFTNGTIANYVLALIFKNDEVIEIPCISYKATVTPLLMANWKIKTINVDDDRVMLPTPNMCVPVSLFGNTVDASNYPRLLFVDDCQGYLGSTTSYTKSISFDYSKNITGVNGGGAILTNDISVYYKAKALQKNNNDTSISMNFKMPYIDGLVIYHKLDHIGTIQTNMKETHERVRNGLKDTGIKFNTNTLNYQKLVAYDLVLDGYKHAYDYYLHDFSGVENKTTFLPKKSTFIPFGGFMTNQEIEYVVNGVKNSLKMQRIVL